MNPELIGILAVGAALASLMLAIWRDARAHTNHGLAELRTQVRAHIAQVRAESQSHREENRAGLTEVKTDIAGLRTDVHSLSERQSRTEGVIEGLFSSRGDPDRRNDAA